MAKATEDNTNHPMMKLSAGEVQSLADRLTSRGTSRLLADQPEMQSDMRQAARVIRALLIAFEHAAGHALQNVLIAAGGR
jgi:hypothetical protein